MHYLNYIKISGGASGWFSRSCETLDNRAVSLSPTFILEINEILEKIFGGEKAVFWYGNTGKITQFQVLFCIPNNRNPIRTILGGLTGNDYQQYYS